MNEIKYNNFFVETSFLWLWGIILETYTTLKQQENCEVNGL